MATEQAIEKWLPIPGFDLYSVSSEGRVRGDRAGGRYRAGRILEGGTNRCGYLCVSLRRSRTAKKTCTIHRLVLLAFVSPCPPGLQCRHRDGDKTNNCLDNLCWGTALENATDRERHGHVARGTRNGLARLTEEEVRGIRAMLAAGDGISRTARAFGVSKRTIINIRNGRTWAHVR